MTHSELTAAVRQRELLAPTSAERHGCYRNRPNPLNVAFGNALLGLVAASQHCRPCGGNGEIRVNLSTNRDPQCDDVVTCPSCHGTGKR
jgi:hypothetical protein